MPRPNRGKTQDEFSVDIDLTEVNKALAIFPAKIQRSLVTSALRFAAQPLKKQMESNARRTMHPSSGALAESIGIKASRGGRKGGGIIRRIWVGPMRSDPKALLKYLSFYGKTLTRSSANSGIRHGHLVEFGFTAGNGRQVPAQPFIRPAFDATKAQIGSRFKQKFAQRIPAIIKRIEKEVKANAR